MLNEIQVWDRHKIWQIKLVNWIPTNNKKPAQSHFLSCSFPVNKNLYDIINEIFVRFVEIDRIVDYHCLIVHFIIFKVQ
jgi:hypothetical protein